MRSALLLLPLFLILSVCASWAAPALVVENISHDFGQLVEGESLVYTYRFHNAGDQVLDIGNVRVSCGCTAALLSERRLAPGMLGELKVTFDSRGFRGKIQKVINFETNDPKHPSVTFTLSGTVKALLQINPQRVNWGRVTAGSELSQTLEIVNDSDRTIRFESPMTTVADIKAELSQTVIEAGQKATLTVEARFPADKRRLAGYVILRSDFPATPELKVPVSARLSTN